ncbi:transcriptional regulator swi6 [Blyttiomyces sp. JEL0837]|nr:transcriptional regulator swi6 [Blyttiomyces sp. JEL0837]
MATPDPSTKPDVAPAVQISINVPVEKEKVIPVAATPSIATDASAAKREVPVIMVQPQPQQPQPQPIAPSPLVPSVTRFPLTEAAGSSVPAVYGAVYSGVPVYEMMVKNVAMMRRRADSYLNATQILKVAGVEKGKRTKILEREILNGDHEKVQGGYGKYQGTWIPFERGIVLAKLFGVDRLMRPLIDFKPPPPGHIDRTPTKEQALREARKFLGPGETLPGAVAKRKDPNDPTRKPKRALEAKGAGPKTGADGSAVGAAGGEGGSDLSSPVLTSDRDSPPWSPGGPSKKKLKLGEDARVTETSAEAQQAERYKSFLMAIFLNEDPNHVPDILTQPTLPPDFDIDMVIDDQGHTPLHWAAALARINILKLLVAKGASVTRTNYNGESALVRAVLVTNNYDNQSFKSLLPILSDTVPLTDNKNRTVLHHIMLTANIKGRVQSSKYYLDRLIDFCSRNNINFKSLVDLQDKNGDTALNVAARIGNRGLIEILIQAGANSEIENSAGLKPADFGFDDLFKTNDVSNVAGLLIAGASSATAAKSGATDMIETPKEVISAPALRFSPPPGPVPSFEIGTVVQKMVDEVSSSFKAELRAKAEQLSDTQLQLREITRDLSEIRKQNQALRLQNQRLPDLTVKVRHLEKAIRDEITRGQEREKAAREVSIKEATDAVTSQNGTSSSDPAAEESTEVLKKKVQLLEAHIAKKDEDERCLREEIVALRGQSGSQEALCKKIIAACLSIPPENVDDLLDPLLAAVESDDGVDLNDVVAFMGQSNGGAENG